MKDELADFFELLSPIQWSGNLYRAIYTVAPSQNLFSDIGFREGDPDLDIILQMADQDAGIDFARPQHERLFQYGSLENLLGSYVSEVIPRDELLYPLRNAQRTRFSDGSFPIFYGALEEDTALAETAYHFVQSAQYEKLTAADIFIGKTIDKRIVMVNAQADRAFDFRSQTRPELTADDYSFCQQLGLYLLRTGADLALAPSARRIDGTCVPVLREEAIHDRKASTIRYYHFSIDRDGNLTVFKSSHEESQLQIPPTWHLGQPGMESLQPDQKA